MPRIRQPPQYRHLTEFQKGRIIGLRNEGVSYRAIGREIGCNAATVLRWWRRWNEERNCRRRNGSGRPRVSTPREDQRLRVSAIRDRHSTTREIGNNWTEALRRPISTSTLYRRIRSFGLRSYRPLLTLPLTPEHRARRLEWCNDRRNWVQEWHHVVFSDESRFCLWVHDGRKRVRRFRGERRNPDFFVERHTARTPGLMVWGAICHGSRSPLVFIEGTLTATSYVANVLEPILLPYLQDLEAPIFQQDNARPHTARASIEFLENADVDRLPWPACSPDLSPIEHVWDMMGTRLGQLPHPPRNLRELRLGVQEAWDNLPQEDIDHLIESMPHRVIECLENRGGGTHY